MSVESAIAGRDVSARPVALVTGASRGIGRGIALALAAAGHDVALGARTLAPGERRESSSTIARSNTDPLPGSLGETAELARATGARALPVYLDLLDRVSWGAAIATVRAQLGPVDVLVNCGRYVGPGHMDAFLDTPLELLDRHIEANVMAPLALTRLVLDEMLARGGGTILNVTSRAGVLDPPGPAGAGGWGLGYGVSKGALQRIAGVLAAELGDRGIRALNLQPGLVATERTTRDGAGYGLDPARAGSPEMIGAVAAWLLTTAEGSAVANGSEVDAQRECRERGLLDGRRP